MPCRERLAGYWNAWFSPREIERARVIAETGSEQECEAELARLERVRKGRLQEWRWSQ